jgi:DNA-binding NarL/FixJ family response regulator
LTVSIGITIFPLDGRDLDTLLRNADVAMHYAKERGRNNYQFYSPELDAHTRRDELRRAETERRLASLTPREREVLDLLISGKASKMIAYLLGTSSRTIDIHRARVMEKMGADSLPELVRMVLEHRRR